MKRKTWVEMKMCRRKQSENKRSTGLLNNDAASISKMKHLSQKTKIKAECCHKGKGDGRPCCIIQTRESQRQRKVIGRHLSCDGATHTERCGPRGELCSE